ncbi:MAG: tetratricopeptide repeat protein, partial [Bacteroidales bacterium]
MTRKFLITAVAFACLITGQTLIAQKTIALSPRHEIFQRGLELYEKQKYGAAREVFETVLNAEMSDGSMLVADARYYLAMSALKLYHSDAEFLVNEFISRHPENPRVNAVRFEMGKYYYTNKKYRDAIDWFAKVEKQKLAQEDLHEYWFKYGYSWFMRNELEKARFAFNEIKDIDTKYTSPALYYYSHIAYHQQNYETALDGFNRLREDATFAQVVPYYIIQILYYQGKYDELIAYAPGVISQVSEKRLPEVSRLTGDAYYRKNMFSEAIPYL